MYVDRCIVSLNARYVFSLRFFIGSISVLKEREKKNNNTRENEKNGGNISSSVDRNRFFVRKLP